MKLTGRQKLYIGILIIAGVGLLYDRLFILPQNAGAQVLDETEERLDQETGPSEFMPESESKTTLSERLDQLVPDDRLEAVDRRDIFAVCPAWSHTMTPDDTPEMSQTVIETFQNHHKLKAIIVSGSKTLVYVDDKIIRPGEFLDGFTLATVDGTSATFAGQGVRVVLRLEQGR